MFSGNWIIISSLVLITLAFVALVVFACIFLISVAKSLQKVQRDVAEVINHADDILEGFVPYSHIARRFGKKIEKRVSPGSYYSSEKERPSRHERRKEKEEAEEEEQSYSGLGGAVMDVADLIRRGISLWGKYSGGRRR